MVEEGDSIIGFGLMVKGVDFDLSFNCGSRESLKFLHCAFGQYHSSNSSKKRHSRELVHVSIVLTFEKISYPKDLLSINKVLSPPLFSPTRT